MLNNIAEELKEARLKNDLTLQQIAAKTRIDLKFLEAMEKGNFAFLPELYVKAFIKEFARHVGIDEDLILKKYEAAKQGKAYEEKPSVAETPAVEESSTVVETPVENKPIPPPADEKPQMKYVNPVQTFETAASSPEKNESDDANTKKKILIGSIIAGTVVVAALVYFLFLNNSSNIIISEKPIDEVIQDNAERYVEEVPETIPDSAASAVLTGDSLRLTITTTDTSWVKIIYDDKRSEEFILFPRGQKIVTAGNNYKITFGKSSAVKLKLNDQPVNFLPANRLVSHVLINRNGLTYLNTPPAQNQEQ